MQKFFKEKLVFSRRESDAEYLIYSAVTRGVHIVPEIVWKFWDSCEHLSKSELRRINGLTPSETQKILTLLIDRQLITSTIAKT